MKSLILMVIVINLAVSTCLDIEDIKYAYEDEKNMILAEEAKNKFQINQDYYYETLYADIESDIDTENSMDVIFFGPTSSFLRMDSETLLHLLINVKKQKIPRSRILLAWDMITDGKTAAYLTGRELYVFCFMLNMVPEEDLYYVNMGDPSILGFFANNYCNVHKRKFGILMSAYRRYYGDTWHRNASCIAELGYILCGVQPSELGYINPQAMKSLTQQTFMKFIRCNRAQRMALYNVATKNEAYGVPYTWTSSEVKNLGVLLICIPTSKIPTLSLQAVSAIDPNVIRLIDRKKLDFFTNQQILSMMPKTRKVYVSRMEFSIAVLEKVNKALALSIL